MPGLARTSATVIVNAGSAVPALPSLTLMTMFAFEPATVGVPESWPVAVLNAAQLGRFWMLKPSVSPFASLAVGRKLYADPTFALAEGEPLIVGAVFVGVCVVVAFLTVIVNAGSETVLAPSVVEITAGDTVRWIFVGTVAQSTTSSAGQAEFWDSGLVQPNLFFDVVLDISGAYVYYDQTFGADDGMGGATGLSGTVIVKKDSDGDGLSNEDEIVLGTNRFDAEDRSGLEEFVRVLIPRLDWDTLLPSS